MKKIGFISLLLILCLVVGCLPITQAAAYDSELSTLPLAGNWDDPQWQVRLKTVAEYYLRNVNKIAEETINKEEIIIDEDHIVYEFRSWTADEVEEYIASGCSEKYIQNNFEPKDYHYMIPIQYKEHQQYLPVSYTARGEYALLAPQEYNHYTRDLRKYSVEGISEYFGEIGLQDLLPVQIIKLLGLDFILCKDGNGYCFVYFPREASEKYMDMKPKEVVDLHQQCIKAPVVQEKDFIVLMRQLKAGQKVDHAPTGGQTTTAEQVNTETSPNGQEETVREEETVTPPSVSAENEPLWELDEEQSPKDNSWLWIIGGAVVLIGGVLTVVLIRKKRKNG